MARSFIIIANFFFFFLITFPLFISATLPCSHPEPFLIAFLFCIFSVRLLRFNCGYSGFLDLSVDLWPRPPRLAGVLWPGLRYLATVICAIGLSLIQGNILNFCLNFLPFFRSLVGNLNYYYFLCFDNVQLTDFLTLHTRLLVLWYYITVASWVVLVVLLFVAIIRNCSCP